MSVTNVTIPTTQSFLLVDTRTGPNKVLFLPTASTIQGRYLSIKDYYGNATASTLTISTTGLDRIDQRGIRYTLASSFGSVMLLSDGLRSWNLMGLYEGGDTAVSMIPVVQAATVVTSGLVYHLDAGNTSSYSGSGTTWSDLTGSGNSMTLINGPTYSSSYGGYISFNPSSSQYANTSTSLTSTPIWTAEVWHYYTGTGVGSAACILTENYPGTTYAIQFLLGYGGGTSIAAMFYNSGFYSTPSYTPPATNAWYHIVGNYTGSALNLYVNGTLSQTFATTATAAPNGAGFKLMARWDAPGYGDYWGGGIAILRIYNRALSGTEILQNYNAQKSRFGLT